MNQSEIFEKFDLTESDNYFISTIDSVGYLAGPAPTGKANALASFYLAKQIEKSTTELAKCIDDNRTALVISLNTNVDNMIESNKKLAIAAGKQTRALNIFTVILVVLTTAMLYKMIWP